MGNKKAFCKHIKRRTQDRAGPLLKEEEKLKIDVTKMVEELMNFCFSLH